MRVVVERGELTVNEAAAALRVVPTTVLRLIHRKALAPSKHARAHHGLSVKSISTNLPPLGPSQARQLNPRASWLLTFNGISRGAA